MKLHSHFDFGRLWKHVQRRYGFDGESFPQFRQIARQRRGIAGNVNECCREKIDNGSASLRGQAGGRWIDNHNRFCAVARFESARQMFVEITGDIIFFRRRIRARRFDRETVPINSNDARKPITQSFRKNPEPQNASIKSS